MWGIFYKIRNKYIFSAQKKFVFFLGALFLCAFFLNSHEIAANTVPDYVEITRDVEDKYLENYVVSSPEYELSELDVNSKILDLHLSKKRLEEVEESISENTVNLEKAKSEREKYALSGNELGIVGMDEIIDHYEKILENDRNTRFSYAKEVAVGDYYSKNINSIVNEKYKTIDYSFYNKFYGLVVNDIGLKYYEDFSEIQKRKIELSKILYENGKILQIDLEEEEYKALELKDKLSTLKNDNQFIRQVLYLGTEDIKSDINYGDLQTREAYVSNYYSQNTKLIYYDHMIEFYKKAQSDSNNSQYLNQRIQYELREMELERDAYKKTINAMILSLSNEVDLLKSRVETLNKKRELLIKKAKMEDARFQNGKGRKIDCDEINCEVLNCDYEIAETRKQIKMNIYILENEIVKE